MNDADARLLIRSADPAIVDVLNRAAGVMERCVNYGTHLIGTLHENRTLDSITPLLLGRHVVEMLDGMSVMVRRSSIDPCDLLLRSQFEALCGLLYMAEKDTLRRARQYEVCVNHARIAMHEKIDATTQSGKQFLAEWARDELLKTIPYKPYDSKPNVTRLTDQLSEPKYAEVEAEWQRMKLEQKATRKANQGAAPINWYSMFGGPRDIQGLARHVAKPGYYEMIYRRSSTYAHATDVHTAARFLSNRSGGQMLRLRFPRELPLITQFAVSNALQTFRTLIAVHGREDLQAAYADWYVRELQQDFMLLSHTTINAPWLE